MEKVIRLSQKLLIGFLLPFCLSASTLCISVDFRPSGQSARKLSDLVEDGT
jgi:hypothetical protein